MEHQPSKPDSEAPESREDGAGKPEPEKGYVIRIDRAPYEVFEEKLAGAQLRRIPPTPIPPERDLFQIIPGHPDMLVKDDDTIEISDGLRFFTAPNTINPGMDLAGPV